MKVECERCKTEYQFDDAIVSARGTTVRCTNCGHQFRVKRAEDAEGSDDRFTIRREDGTEVTFESLRELQRAILSRAILRDDVLVRGSIRRPLSTIAELRPLFDERRGSSRPPASVGSRVASKDAPPTPIFEQTLRMGSVPPPPPKKSSVPPPPTDARRPPLSAPPQGKPASARSDGAPSTDPVVNLPPKSKTLRPAVAALPPAPESSGSLSSQRRASEPEPETVRRIEDPDDNEDTPVQPLPDVTKPMTPPSSSMRSSRPPPLPARASQRVPAAQPIAATPANATAHLDRAITAPMPIPPSPPPSLDMRGASARPPSSPPIGMRRSGAVPATTGASVPAPPLNEGRRPLGGIILAVALLAGLAILAVVALKKDAANGQIAEPTATGPAPTASAPDGENRLAKYLELGQRALLAGDTEVAKENVDKASVVAETDPRVTSMATRVAITRADLAWITLQATTKGGIEAKVATDRLTEAVARLTSVDKEKCAPAHRVDLDRLNGNLDAARAAAKTITDGDAIDAKYARAAIALADRRFDGVVAELGGAVGEATFGARERALLALGHLRAGAPDKARDVLNAAPVPALVAAPIRAALPPDLSKDGSAAAALASGAVTGAPATSGPDVSTADSREILKGAEQARAKGDYDRALRLYSIALDRNSRDSEALNGIADVEHAMRNLPAARASYQRVLGVNGSYLPALVGLADVEWESGNTAGAQKMYKDIADRFPEGAYPARVRQRGEPQPKPADPTPAPTAVPSSTATEPSP